MACAPSEDSDQPGHLPSLIRIFAVHMKKAWVLSYPVRVFAGSTCHFVGCHVLAQIHSEVLALPEVTKKCKKLDSVV